MLIAGRGHYLATQKVFFLIAYDCSIEHQWKKNTPVKPLTTAYKFIEVPIFILMVISIKKKGF